MMLLEPKYLSKEMILFHQRIFSFEAVEEVISHYIKAHQVYQAKMDSSEAAFISFIVEKGVDLEAVEYVWRLKKKNNLLTQKLGILLFVCEVFPQYQNSYLNFCDNRLAIFELFFYLFRSFYKAVKGLIIFNIYSFAYSMQVIRER
jgi:hypothetical protein